MKLVWAIAFIAPEIACVVTAVAHYVYHRRFCTICRFVTALKRRS